MAWAATFERDEEKWLAMILDTMAQRKGLGSALLKTISNQQGDLNGWVIDHDREIKQNGSPYLSPINFYVKNNFVICSSVRLETEKISAVKIKWNYNHNV